MKFTIEPKTTSKCKKYNFSLYNHSLSMADLDNYILDIIYDVDKLNYLFQLDTPLGRKDRINQLRRFIETDFVNKESEVTDAEIRLKIKNNTNQSYYSFFAEALLARLNIDYIDNDLVSGVIAMGDNLIKVSTGADVCMYSDENLVLGEAKFYSNLYGGANKVITDTSFLSKLDDFIKKITNSKNEIKLKNITGDVSEKTADEIRSLPLVLSGFVLHTKDPQNNYNSSYQLVNSMSIANLPTHYKIHLYHLPIESKNELIFKAQRKALDLIIAL